MRHAEFHINIAAHDAWIKAMRTAVDGVEMKSELKEQLWSYLEMAAAAMVNQPD
jgi:hemoglobin